MKPSSVYLDTMGAKFGALGRLVFILVWPALYLAAFMVSRPIVNAVTDWFYGSPQFFLIQAMMAIVMFCVSFLALCIVPNIMAYVISYVVRGHTSFIIKEEYNFDKNGSEAAWFLSLLYIKYWFHLLFNERPPRPKKQPKRPKKTRSAVDPLLATAAEELEQFIQHDPYEDLKSHDDTSMKTAEDYVSRR